MELKQIIKEMRKVNMEWSLQDFIRNLNMNERKILLKELSLWIK